MVVKGHEEERREDAGECSGGVFNRGLEMQLWLSEAAAPLGRVLRIGCT